MAYTVLRSNTAAGGTAGQAVTDTATQPANSGDPFDEVFVSAGVSATISADAPPGHTRSWQVTRASTGAFVLAWTTSLTPSPVDPFVCELWLKVTEERPIDTTVLARGYNDLSTPASARQWDLAYDSRGRVFVRDVSNHTAVCRTPLRAGVWYRVEVRVQAGVKAWIKASEGTSQVTYSAGESLAWASSPVVAFQVRANGSEFPGATTSYGPVRVGNGTEFFTPTTTGHEPPLVSAGLPQTAIEPGALVRLSGVAEGLDAAVTEHVWTPGPGAGGPLLGEGSDRLYRAGATLGGYVQEFTYTAVDATGAVSQRSRVTHQVLPAAETATGPNGQPCPVLFWVQPPAWYVPPALPAPSPEPVPDTTPPAPPVLLSVTEPLTGAVRQEWTEPDDIDEVRVYEAGTVGRPVAVVPAGTFYRQSGQVFSAGAELLYWLTSARGFLESEPSNSVPFVVGGSPSPTPDPGQPTPAPIARLTGWAGPAIPNTEHEVVGTWMARDSWDSTTPGVAAMSRGEWLNGSENPDYRAFVDAHPDRAADIGVPLIPHDSVPPSGWNALLDEVIARSRDSVFTSMGAALANGGPRTMFFRLWWEFNMNPQAGSIDRARFIAAWRIAYTLIHQGFKAAQPTKLLNILWCPIADGADYAPFWPGDAYVDGVSIDVYDNRWGTVTPTKAELATIVQGQLDAITTFAAAHDKPLSLGEWGLGRLRANDGSADSRGIGDHPEFIDRIFNWIEANDVTHAVYFNLTDGAGQAITDNAPLSLARYQPRAGTVTQEPPATTTLFVDQSDYPEGHTQFPTYLWLPPGSTRSSDGHPVTRGRDIMDNQLGAGGDWNIICPEPFVGLDNKLGINGGRNWIIRGLQVEFTGCNFGPYSPGKDRVVDHSEPMVGNALRNQFLHVNGRNISSNTEAVVRVIEGAYGKGDWLWEGITYQGKGDNGPNSTLIMQNCRFDQINWVQTTSGGHEGGDVYQAWDGPGRTIIRGLTVGEATYQLFMLQMGNTSFGNSNVRLLEMDRIDVRGSRQWGHGTLIYDQANSSARTTLVGAKGSRDGVYVDVNPGDAYKQNQLAQNIKDQITWGPSPHGENVPAALVGVNYLGAG